LLVAVRVIPVPASIPVVDPAGHLRGLPVGIVNEDAGTTVGSTRVDLGQTVAVGLERAPAVTSRLALRTGNPAAIEHRMDVAKEYAVVRPKGIPSRCAGAPELCR
jgi:hypothetical protein